MNMKIISIIGLLLSVLGFYEAFKISAIHFSTVEYCPTIGFLPACYVVFISYGLMSLGWIGVLTERVAFLTKRRSVLFWMGFTPTFLLALTGMVGEIFGFIECPETPNHFPKCFISFGFVLVISALWIGRNFMERSQKI